MKINHDSRWEMATIKRYPLRANPTISGDANETVDQGRLPECVMFRVSGGGVNKRITGVVMQHNFENVEPNLVLCLG